MEWPYTSTIYSSKPHQCKHMYTDVSTQWWTDKYVRLQVGIGHFDASMSFILVCCEKLLTLNCRNRVGVMIYPPAPSPCSGILLCGAESGTESGAQSVAWHDVILSKWVDEIDVSTLTLALIERRKPAVVAVAVAVANGDGQWQLWQLRGICKSSFGQLHGQLTTATATATGNGQQQLQLDIRAGALLNCSTAQLVGAIK